MRIGYEQKKPNRTDYKVALNIVTMGAVPELAGSVDKHGVEFYGVATR